MRQQHRNKIIKLLQLYNPLKQWQILCIQCNSKRQLVVAFPNVFIHHISHNLVVTTMFITIHQFTPSVFDVLLHTLVDKYLCKLVLSTLDIEVISCLQGIAQCLLILVEIEVEFRQQDGDSLFVGKLIIIQQ